MSDEELISHIKVIIVRLGFIQEGIRKKDGRYALHAQIGLESVMGSLKKISITRWQLRLEMFKHRIKLYGVIGGILSYFD